MKCRNLSMHQLMHLECIERQFYYPIHNTKEHVSHKTGYESQYYVDRRNQHQPIMHWTSQPLVDVNLIENSLTVKHITMVASLWDVVLACSKHCWTFRSNWLVTTGDKWTNALMCFCDLNIVCIHGRQSQHRIWTRNNSQLNWCTYT